MYSSSRWNEERNKIIEAGTQSDTTRRGEIPGVRPQNDRIRLQKKLPFSFRH